MEIKIIGDNVFVECMVNSDFFLVAFAAFDLFVVIACIVCLV
jgi:hypothetical protein